MTKLPITVILPAHNEEKTIERCLNSISFADDILVVNGASSDRTRDLASRHHVRILDTDNDFAEGQRLKALPMARHPWVFLIDSDEVVTAELKTSIEKAISDPAAAAAYRVLRRNIYRGRAVHIHSPDHQLRLFQKEKTRFPDKIHRRPEIDGPIGALDGCLDHYFFTTIQDYLRRLNGYTDAEVSYRIKELGSLSAWGTFKGLWLKPFWRFLECYFLKKGVLDGYFGFFYSVSSAYYEWVITSKLLLEKSAAGDVREIRRP